MLSRNIEPNLAAAMADTPVVLINGARQTGKTTLVQAFAAGIKQATYVTFDDASMLAAAVGDPQGFIDGLEGTAVIDGQGQTSKIETKIVSLLIAGLSSGATDLRLSSLGASVSAYPRHRYSYSRSTVRPVVDFGR